MSGGRGVLHNVTLYVQKERLGEERAFYADAVGLPIVFEESAHICCFEVGEGSTDVAICIHEEEQERPAGTCDTAERAQRGEGGSPQAAGTAPCSANRPFTAAARYGRWKPGSQLGQ